MNARERTQTNLYHLKTTVLTHYGNGKLACVHCGFNDIRALSIDHIDGGGLAHRKKIGLRTLYRWLFDNNFPEGYQTLCMNCQFIKQLTGSTPNHKITKTKPVAQKVRQWVEIRQQAFWIRDIMISLALTKDKHMSVRNELCRLKKRGVIQNSTQPGHYKKVVRGIKVFG